MHTPTLVVALTGISLALANPAPAAAPQPIITPGAILPRPGGAAIDARQFVVTESRTAGGAPISQHLACQRSLVSLADTVPTPPARVVAWLATAITVPTLTDPDQLTDDSLTTLCDATKTITPPASLTAAYSSYTESVSEWASSVAPAANSVASSCGGVESALIMIQIATDSGSCTSAVQDLLQVVRGELSSSSGIGTSVATITRTHSGSSSQETSTVAAAGTESSAGSGESSTDSASGAGAGATSSSSTAGAAVGPRETGFLAAAAAAAAAVGIAGAVAAL